MVKKKRFLSFLKSLKFHLIFVILLLTIIPGIIISQVVINNYNSRAISIRESEVSAQAQIFANQIATSEYLASNQIGPDTLQTQLSMLSTIYDGRIMVINDAYVIVYDTYNLDARKTILAHEVVKSFGGETVISYDSENHYIEMTLPIIDPNDKLQTVQGVMLVSVSTDNIALNTAYLNKVAAIVDSIAIVVFAFFGILFVIISMKPFSKLSKRIEEIHGGYGGDALDVNEFTETAVLCEKFNHVLAEMKVVNDSREEFVSNVSHELKTPLTSMKVLADSINSMPEAPLEMYQEFMGDITNEIDRETKIINDLLSLVKMDKSGADLNIANININELVEQILKRLQPIAERQKVSVMLESFRPIMADVDEVKLSLAITNLVENGIKYNKNDGEGWVHVTLNADHQYFYLKVEDSGMGIPEESLDHIFERFYRVDKSHSREIGGTGLGLAITRNAVLMHRGSIKVFSELGEGTTFDVRIPLTYIA